MVKPKYTYIIFILVLTAIAQLGYAQKKLEFETTIHNFGNITEGEPAEATFTFKNTGKEPITLVNVHASCGCTTPSWTKTPVAPGQTGTVKATYDSKNRQGSFNKTITVRTDGEPQYIVLRITGDVKQSTFNKTVGNLKMEKVYAYFGNIYVDSQATHTFRIMNGGNEVMTIFPEKIKKPAHLTVNISKNSLQPNEEALVVLRFDASKIKDWGYSYGSFNIETDDKEKPQKRVGFAAKIKENFAGMPEGTQHPKVIYDKTRHDFGNIQQRTQVQAEFKIKNEGEGTLYIRKTKASCGCTVSVPKKNVLAPGEETVLEVTYSTGSRKGKQKKSITVITNDPNKDEVILWIEGHIEIPKSQEGGK